MHRRVAVIGGGYAGTLVAKTLDAEAEVILIDPRDAFVNVAGSLRALTRPDWAANVFFPFDTLLERGNVLHDSAVSVDPGGVMLASGRRVEADYLVLATGSSYPYPARPKQASTSQADALDDLRGTNKELSGAERVLILGAGPVGLELAGEIKDVWPDKHVVIVDPADQLMPGLLAEVRASLRTQLDELGIELRIGTTLTAPPGTDPGRADRFSVTTGAGDVITADLWFRTFGLRVNSDYLADGKLAPRTERATLAVTDTLTVRGYDHVYALGDLADLDSRNMATYAQEQALIVVENIRTQLAGKPPEAVYSPDPEPRILLPLGTRRGVGQVPTPDGIRAATTETVSERKGRDLFTERFAQRFASS